MKALPTLFSTITGISSSVERAACAADTHGRWPENHLLKKCTASQCRGLGSSPKISTTSGKDSSNDERQPVKYER